MTAKQYFIILLASSLSVEQPLQKKMPTSLPSNSVIQQQNLPLSDITEQHLFINVVIKEISPNGI